jgi:hypothetical protein
MHISDPISIEMFSASLGILGTFPGKEGLKSESCWNWKKGTRHVFIQPLLLVITLESWDCLL